jgi:hypothetical protein
MFRRKLTSKVVALVMVGATMMPLAISVDEVKGRCM